MAPVRLWRGDDLWYDRWQQAMYLAPEFIEIISWNDYGESYYIGPIYDIHNDLAAASYAAFDKGDAPYNYVAGYDHGGWRALLPFLIDTYKYNVSTITEEGLTAWYRLNAAGACASDGGTTGNTVSQLQLEYPPKDIPQDKIFYSALLASPADVVVTVDGVSLGAAWTHTPSGDADIYHGSVSITGHSGSVEITVTRGGSTVVSVLGEEIFSGCSNTLGIENWNAWVGSKMAGNRVSAMPASLADQVCIEGWGKGNFSGLCEFTCGLGYCPVGACVCTKMGPPPTKPKATGIQGYPTAGESPSYSGLCSFACNYGGCIEGVCSTVKVPLTIPTVSPFTPDTCTAGSGEGSFAGLCSYACNVGYCPIHNCTCTATGSLNVPKAANASIHAVSTVGGDSGLCTFACERGYCPSPTCVSDKDSPAPACADDGTDPRPECAEVDVCDFTKSYPTLDDLEAALDTIEPACVDFYTLDGLGTTLGQTLDNYTHITSSYDSKFDDYVNNLTATYGIERDWVVFKECKLDLACTPPMDKGGCSALHRKYEGFPVKAPDSDIKVANPKDIMTQAMPHIQNLTENMVVAQIELALGSWMGLTDDVVRSFSMAVFLLSQAVINMQNVVDVAEKYEEAKKKEMINDILMGILLVLPFLGELDAIADSLLGMSRIITMIGDAGMGAMTVYSVVEDPKMAPLTILETLLMYGMRNPGDFDRMGTARRDTTEDDIKSIGASFKEQNDQLQTIVAKCAKAP